MTAADLDSPRAVVGRDADGMLAHILGLPEQLRDAWRLAQSVALPESYRDPAAVAILGLGGSAIGGDLVRSAVSPELRVPLAHVRDYDLPAFVGPATLVIASSHSGETEETLAAFDAALARGARAVAVTTGGTLLARARAAGVPTVQFHYPSQPRAAVGYSTLLPLGILEGLGLVSPKSADVAEAAELLGALALELGPAVPTARNLAKELARFLHGRIALVYGGVLAEAARRWKGQINENAKTWAYFEALPELDHNAVVAFEDPAGLRERVGVVLLAAACDHPRTRLRFTATAGLLDRYGVAHRSVAARGCSRLAQVLGACYLGDFVSYYLAALGGVDPTPIEPIVVLKAELAASRPAPAGEQSGGPAAGAA